MGKYERKLVGGDVRYGSGKVMEGGNQMEGGSYMMCLHRVRDTARSTRVCDGMCTLSSPTLYLLLTLTSSFKDGFTDRTG